jgi:hypothetical protein
MGVDGEAVYRCRFRSGAKERHVRVFAICALVSHARRAVATE